MKLIIAIIKPQLLESVREMLYKVNANMTVTEVLGHSSEKSFTEIYRGTKELGTLLRKIRIEIAANDEDVESIIRAIVKGAKTGEAGDGKIFVMPLDQCIRIGTEERGTEAIS